MQAHDILHCPDINAGAMEGHGCLGNEKGLHDVKAQLKKGGQHVSGL